MAKEKPEKGWQYILPCAFFDGPNSALHEIQGWRKIKSADVVSSVDKFWNMQSVGSSESDEKWATERHFLNDDSGITAVTYDVFDKGIAFMVWRLANRDGDNCGFAIKQSGKWYVMEKDESFLDDFEYVEIAEPRRMAKINRLLIKIIKADGSIVAEIDIKRED